MTMKHSWLLCIFAFALPAFAEQSTTTIAIHQKAASAFYVKGKLGDLGDADFMVDTGSGYLVINQESLAQLRANGQAQYVKEIRGILANGNKFVVPVWRISSFTIDSQCVLRDVDAAVFPGKTRQILGLTGLIKAAPFVFSFDPPQIVFSNCTQSS